ncbi:SDR family oxidoreductase [Microbacterium sp. LRZ72]|uniref:SDR family NAD(P)-dependent oxidoreductase n=1 Tax=Microbacterium sp. LRZ72 TaxID=2942481 RepID=UPI0029B69816|nr:SDR family oxidoreductase [Microbacterium sp. LRZ72]MDX2377850.1 SDR family oxidoreductase [Microbacterium sp. LRZ72]
MDLRLDERVILVVGGAGYIGSAIAAALAAEGATVVGASRHGGDLTMDARDATSVAAAVEKVLAEHGRLDGVVVTAAPSARTLDPALSTDPDDVLDAIDGKAMSFLRVARAALGPMREAGYGRIVGISGQNAFLTGDLRGSVRNAALILAAKNLADAAAGSGVTVNVVNPGTVVDEPSTTVSVGKSGESAPTDIAALVAFLVSPLAGAISGESIAVGHRVRGASGL